LGALFYLLNLNNGFGVVNRKNSVPFFVPNVFTAVKKPASSGNFVFTSCDKLFISGESVHKCNLVMLRIFSVFLEF